MSEYPQPSWPSFTGESSAPPAPAPIPQFSSSARNSPYLWHNYNRNYTPYPNTIANNLNTGSVGGSQPLPQGNGYEANSPPPCRGMLSNILKKLLSERMAHPDSEIITYRKESDGHGKLKVTVTFETSGEM